MREYGEAQMTTDFHRGARMELRITLLMPHRACEDYFTYFPSLAQKTSGEVRSFSVSSNLVPI